METFVPKGKVFGPILPQFVLEKPLTFGAKIMYALLCNYASEKDHCWPSQATLAAKLSCSVSSVKNYLGELAKAKLIEIRHEQYRSSTYYLLHPTELAAKEAKAVCPESTSACPQPKSGYINNLSNQEKKKDPPLPPAQPAQPKSPPASESRCGGGEDSFVHDFEKAWELYPKKEAKGLARAAWLNLKRIGQLPLLSEVQNSIQRFIATESWKRDQGRFIPQMSNWLRGQRWLDPLSPPAVDQEAQRRLETDRALQAHKEKEEALATQRKAEREKLRPLFDAFAETFKEQGPFPEAMAFGLWMFAHSKNQAPAASDVPDNNALDIIAFMKAFQRKCEQAEYLKRATDSKDRPGKPVSCGELLRNSAILSQLFPVREELCRAV